MKKYVIAILFLIMATHCFSKFYSIKSQREFDRKSDAFEYSFICFARDDFEGRRIKDMMQTLAYGSEFNDDIADVFGILFVYASCESLHDIAAHYGWTEKPLFLILKNNTIIAKETFGQHYSVAAMRRFIHIAIGRELKNVAERRFGHINDDDQDRDMKHWHYRHSAHKSQAYQLERDLL